MRLYKMQTMKVFIHLFSLTLVGLFSTAHADTSGFNYLSVTDTSALANAYSASGIANTVNPFDSNNSLYQQILDEMNAEYQTIGQREAKQVLQNGSTSITGGLNSIGFNYTRPFIDFSIAVNRSLAPDLFDDKRWIVTDTFSIYIDASKVLGNLKDKKLIDISEKNLGAFAGIVFKRTYTWVHFAASYEEGLGTHFEKLFLPFTALAFNNIAKMQANEIVTKEDSISAEAGGLVTAPLYTTGVVSISGQAGMLAKFQQLTKVEVFSNPKSATQPQDDIQISYDKTKSALAGVSLAIQADFLKILKITLLSYDFSYELSSSYKIYMDFKQVDLLEMLPTSPVAMEIQQVLKNREGDLDILAPYIISEEKKLAQTVNHKYNFLLLGGTKTSQTQQIEVTSEGKVKTFFRHYYEKIKYTEDLVSRLFASVIYAITNTEASAAKLASDTKRVTIEYDSEKNLLENHEDLNIEDSTNTQKLSMSFTAEFMTKKSTGFGGKKYRDRAVYLLEHYSGVDPLAVTMVQSEHLRAPFLITGQYQVDTNGIRHLNALSVGEVFDNLSALCDEYPRTSFFNFRNLFDNCRRSLQNDYIDYYKDLSHEKVTSTSIDQCESKAKKYIFSSAKKRAFLKDCLSKITYKDRADWVEIPLWQLKTFTNNIVNNSNTKVDYYNLFGIQNVFFYGNFNAVTEDGRDFTTSFHEGAFKGLGVVDNYMRVEDLRAPSSIVVDQ